MSETKTCHGMTWPSDLSGTAGHLTCCGPELVCLNIESLLLFVAVLDRSFYSFWRVTHHYLEMLPSVSLAVILSCQSYFYDLAPPQCVLQLFRENFNKTPK